MSMYLFRVRHNCRLSLSLSVCVCARVRACVRVCVCVWTSKHPVLNLDKNYNISTNFSGTPSKTSHKRTRVISCLQMGKKKWAYLAVRRVANWGSDKNVRRWRINRLKSFGVKLLMFDESRIMPVRIELVQNASCRWTVVCSFLRYQTQENGVLIIRNICLGVTDKRHVCCEIRDTRQLLFYLLWLDTFRWQSHNTALLTSTILKLSNPCTSDQCNRLS